MPHTYPQALICKAQNFLDANDIDGFDRSIGEANEDDARQFLDTGLPEAKSLIARHALRELVLSYYDEYCNEAEHGDGYEYWDKFQEPKDALTDFALYLNITLEDQNKADEGPHGRNV